MSGDETQKKGLVLEVFSAKSILSNQENTRDGVVLLFLLVVVLVSPWLVVVSLGILARGILSERIGKPALAFALVGFLALFNATKHIDGDWYWYVSDYLEMSQIGLLDYLQEGGLSIRISEPLYYAFSFALSRLSGGNVFVFTLAVSLAVYLTYIFALEKLMKWYGLHRWAAAICIIFAVLAGLTFTQSLHLVRQYMAGSILFLYFVLILAGRNKTAAMLFVTGSLIHNSFVVPAGVIAVCAYLWNLSWVKHRYFWVLFLLLILGYETGSYFTSLIHESPIEWAAVKDEGDVSTVVFLQEGLLFLASLAGMVFLRERQGFYTKGSAIAVLFLAFFGGLLSGIHDLTLWFLRLYFYVEWFRVIGVITIVWFLVFRVKLANLAILIIPLSFLMFGMRVAQSPFNYGGGVFDHLFRSVIWWANNLSAVRY